MSTFNPLKTSDVHLLCSSACTGLARDQAMHLSCVLQAALLFPNSQVIDHMVLKIIAYVVIGFYTISLAYVTFYCLLQFHLLLQYTKQKRKNASSHSMENPAFAELPYVTIQLPLYNERYVAERLIDNIITMNYPVDRMDIQILDDSTDDTSELCRKKVAEYQQQGINISYHHRKHREGYKAGALRDGLPHARGEFIAIFDADFLPRKDFLLETIPYFHDPQTGVVQTRWEHINEDYSLITRLQAFQLNVHFTIEQTGRQNGDYLLQFNGTAGVWRKKAIEDAGGWASDTLTEDLDLSYRAQLKGWKIRYRQEIGSPAELPSEMNGLKSQQFRWMKGGAENARRLIPAVMRSEMSWVKKMHATTHLLSSTIFLFIFALAVLSVPVAFLMSTIGMEQEFYMVFMVSLLCAGCVYYVANKDTTWSDVPEHRRIFKFIILFPLFLSLSMGLSFHNSIAVLQGYTGRKSVFVRTPKFNIQQLQDNFRQSFYKASKASGTTIIEGLLALYFLIAVIAGLEQGKTSFVVYHIMLMIGFGGIFIYSIRHCRI